jgi:hypothetical protein
MEVEARATYDCEARPARLWPLFAPRDAPGACAAVACCRSTSQQFAAHALPAGELERRAATSEVSAARANVRALAALAWLLLLLCWQARQGTT